MGSGVTEGTKILCKIKNRGLGNGWEKICLLSAHIV